MTTADGCLAATARALATASRQASVTDEATALQEDDGSEEDLLVTSQSFDLVELVEDELIMELPAVARHDECPVAVKLSVADPEFEAPEAGKPNPFAALQVLKSQKRN
jgi:uncharacterized protein